MSFGAPPMAVYAAFSGWDQNTTKASLSVYLLPAAFAGVLLSLPFARKMKEDTFRNLLRLLIGAAGLLLLFKALV